MVGGTSYLSTPLYKGSAYYVVCLIRRFEAFNNLICHIIVGYYAITYYYNSPLDIINLDSLSSCSLAANESVGLSQITV